MPPTSTDALTMGRHRARIGAVTTPPTIYCAGTTTISGDRYGGPSRIQAHVIGAIWTGVSRRPV
jgi:hypothetical protein